MFNKGEKRSQIILYEHTVYGKQQLEVNQDKQWITDKNDQVFWFQMFQIHVSQMS